ncbi:SDR family NAD(P)-dependent oxidoreductase [Aquimarina agarilytica]|uniref:SDR family NAD(P)-dependent oxidoreductase n=1 Tax=Aquimarina agarilytica TaxID=1087449 RepID=UPI0002891E8B|nr:SDR family NAD(P)-dependent oxidoreductase [Aquimarina agarilytica]
MSKIVLITGASKGIGLALANKMLKKDLVVIGTSRNGEFNEIIAHKNFYSLKLDLSEQSSIDNALVTILKKFKHIDMLINNAGIGPDLDTNYPEKISFEKTFQVNVTGTVFFTESLIEIINFKGCIINISSEMGAISNCNRVDSVAYRMSKSALNMYTKILANRYKDTLRIASIHPGWVKTTIAVDNSINGNLTPEQSAANICDFIDSDFKSGVYWNTETNSALLW